MVEPAARIRPVVLKDQELIRYVIGKAEMEPIATANRKSYTNPIVLAAWVGLSCAFVEYMRWWPQSEHGVFGYLAPVPAFGTLAIASMFAVDWINRWHFEDRSGHVLRRPDLVSIPDYYSRSPSSGMWILEFGDKFVGLIALDASLDAESDETVGEKGIKQGRVDLTKGTSSIATIRHFFVDEPYRPAGMAKDLLDYALKHAFTSDSKVQAVRAYDSPLRSYIGDALREFGFKLEKNTETVGLLRWRNSIKIVNRSHWAAQRR